MNKVYKLHQCSIVDEGEKDIFNGHFKLSFADDYKLNLADVECYSPGMQITRTIFKGESIEEILKDSIISTAVVLLAAQSGYHSREKAIELAKIVLAKL